jgi:hypothetical protein
MPRPSFYSLPSEANGTSAQGLMEGMTRPSFLALFTRILLGWALWLPLWAQADQSVWMLVAGMQVR